MKMISEAALDDQFNVQLGKIQDAVIKLEKLAQSNPDYKPVKSQGYGLEAVIRDLQELNADLFVGRK